MKLPKGRVSAALAASHVDISVRTFSDLIEAGVIEKQAPTKGYDLDDVPVRYIRHMRVRASGQGDSAGLSHERALRALGARWSRSGS